MAKTSEPVMIKSPHYCLVWVLSRIRGNKRPGMRLYSNRVLWAKDVRESFVSVIFYPRTPEESLRNETPALVEIYGHKYWISENISSRITSSLSDAVTMHSEEREKP